MSGRLVAASTVTSRSCSTPSISVRSWAKTRSPTPPEPDALEGADGNTRQMSGSSGKKEKLMPVRVERAEGDDEWRGGKGDISGLVKSSK